VRTHEIVGMFVRRHRSYRRDADHRPRSRPWGFKSCSGRETVMTSPSATTRWGQAPAGTTASAWYRELHRPKGTARTQWLP